MTTREEAVSLRIASVAGRLPLRHHAGDEIYLVGGAVRDILLDRGEITDFDLVTKNPEKIVKEMRRSQRATVVTLDSEFGVYRILPRNSSLVIDLARMQGEDMYADLGRRDFSVNAMAAKLGCPEVELLDPYGGAGDTERGVIRSLSRQNLVDDPLRILRAFRFRAELGFLIEGETLTQIRELACLLREPARERVKSELLKILKSERAAACFREMTETGLMAHILPEMERCRGFSPGDIHETDLLEHSLRCMEIAEDLVVEDLPEVCGSRILDRTLEMDGQVRSLFKLAAFLHDAGKLFSKRQINDKNVFYGHDSAGMAQAGEMLRNLRFANESIEFVCRLVGSHMYLFHLINTSGAKERLTSRQYLRMKKDAGEYAPLLFTLFIADTRAKGEHLLSEVAIGRITSLIGGYQEFELRDRAQPPLLDGREIMELLGVPQGSEIGKMKLLLREAELAGAVTTKEQAVDFLRCNRDA